MGVAALAVLLLTNPFGPIPAPGSPPEGGTRGGVVLEVNSASSPNLTIRLPEYPQEGTRNLTLDANWGPAPGGCSIQPEWSAWFLPSPGSAGGTFTSPGAARTQFAPAGLTSGTSEVGVRSDADLSCGSANRTLEGVAFSNVTTFATLTLTNLSVDPSATSAPALVHLRGVVSGGRAPYLLGIEWGDGSTTNRTLWSPGPFIVPHPFGPGTYLPRLGVYDSDRIDVRGSAPEPVEVSNGTVLAINASLPLAEVGVPLQFRGTAQRPVAHFGAVIACATDPTVLPADNITNVTCTPTAPGVLEVTFKVGAPIPQFVAQTTREEPVAPALALTVRPVTPSLDAGTLMYIRVTIAGGVPPFQISCRSQNGTLTSTSNAPADGSFLVAWTPPYAGGAVLDGTVRDSLGMAAVAASVKLIVNAPPNAAFLANSSIGPTASTVEVGATIAGGSPPLFWGFDTDLAPATGPPAVGETDNGSFAWSGTFFVEGVSTFSFQIEDAAGTVIAGTVAIALPAVPTVRALNLSVPPTGPSVLHLTLATVGGVAPFSLWLNSSGSPLWNANEPTQGPYLVTVPLERTGPVALSITLTDARDARTSLNLSTIVPVPPVALPALGAGPEPDPVPWVVGAALLALLAGFVVTRWRRRDPAQEGPLPDPEELLERLLRPAEGADRLTIELMAEEEGVPLETVHETLDRLIREGRVRSESDPDGGEVLAWSAD